MNEPPYSDARRVFWIVDNGSSHRGQASIERLQAAYPYIATYAAIPVLPGFLITYEEYQIGPLAGFGGFCLHAWYGKNIVWLGRVEFWVS
jgi:hypothetical protein